MIDRLKPISWFPKSLETKFETGFKRDSQVSDGSRIIAEHLQEISEKPTSHYDNILYIYSLGVEGYEGNIFSPKQIAAMILLDNVYRRGDICTWISGIRTDQGIIYGPKFENKIDLLKKLCSTLDNFKSKNQEEIRLAANYSQLIFLIIHPFWNRNGRTSEESMHLFCLKNNIDPLVFWDIYYQRCTDASKTRMALINSQSQQILAETLNTIGVNTHQEKAETQGYQELFGSTNSPPISRQTLRICGPYLYRFLSQKLDPKKSNLYFDALNQKLLSMINLLKPGNTLLKNNTQAIDLYEHQIKYGRSFLNDSKKNL